MTKWIVVALACLLASRLAAQNGLTARTLCDTLDPANRCPGPNCVCSEDVLEFRFDSSSGPTIELDNVAVGLRLDAEVMLDTKSRTIQGWSYGVRHNGQALAIESVTTDGSDVANLFQTGFNATRFENIVECSSSQGATGCSDPSPATGFISAVVLSLIQNVTLPVGSNSIAKATYRVEASAEVIGEGGTPIEFTEVLALRNSPPVSISFTDSGRSVRPSTVVDGRIFVSLAGKDFHRGDADTDGRLSVADAISILLFLFLAGPAPECLDSADFDDDGRLDTTDPVLILHWLFLDASAPAPPGPPPAPCGPDPAGSTLGCESYGACS